MIFYIGINIQTNDKIKDNGKQIQWYMPKFNIGCVKESRVYVKCYLKLLVLSNIYLLNVT